MLIHFIIKEFWYKNILIYKDSLECSSMRIYIYILEKDFIIKEFWFVNTHLWGDRSQKQKVMDTIILFLMVMMVPMVWILGSLGSIVRIMI